jgi:cytochrome c-type biogenesis protein CcmH
MRFLLALMLFLTPALAVLPDEVLQDAGKEALARRISQEIRCMVCQNQSIDDSDAPLAKDLRLLVRERIMLGESEGDVKSYLRERYGDFILLKPPLSFGTLILWFLPAFVLLLGGLTLLLKRKQLISDDLSADEQEELSKVLEK